MAKNDKTHFLREATRILSYIGISKSKCISIGSKRIPIKLIRWFFITSNVFNIAMEIVICVRFYKNDEARAILVPLHLAMAFAMAFFIHINLLRKHDEIIELIECLQRVIAASKYELLESMAWLGSRVESSQAESSQFKWFSVFPRPKRINAIDGRFRHLYRAWCNQCENRANCLLLHMDNCNNRAYNANDLSIVVCDIWISITGFLVSVSYGKWSVSIMLFDFSSIWFWIISLQFSPFREAGLKNAVRWPYAHWLWNCHARGYVLLLDVSHVVPVIFHHLRERVYVSLVLHRWLGKDHRPGKRWHSTESIHQRNSQAIHWTQLGLLQASLIAPGKVTRDFFDEKSSFFFCSLMESLGKIISAPIFFQISIFGVELAVVLCQLETVSHWNLFAWGKRDLEKKKTFWKTKPF